jgi:hypothetical protein
MYHIEQFYFHYHDCQPLLRVSDCPQNISRVATGQELADVVPAPSEHDYFAQGCKSASGEQDIDSRHAVDELQGQFHRLELGRAYAREHNGCLVRRKSRVRVEDQVAERPELRHAQPVREII